MKKFSLDRLLIQAAYIYISVPFIIFLAGWVRWYIAVPLCLVTGVAAFMSLQGYKNAFKTIYIKQHRKKIIAVLCVVLIWVGFSGIGGFSYQTWDHNFRNAIFRDLVTNSWPVIYHVKGFGINHPLEGQTCMMSYYIGFWLPAAVVGKLFGWYAANAFLFLWAVTGILLIFYFVCRLFNVFTIRLLLLFIFWSTAYVIGLFVKYPVKTIIQSESVLWAGNMYYADNNTGLLYWVFNQSITPWLTLMLLLNQIPRRNIFFVLSLCFFQGPLAFLGLFPFGVYLLLKDSIATKPGSGQAIDSLKSFQNVAGALSVLVISLLFFSSNSAAGRFVFVPRNPWIYILFILLSFGIVAILLFQKFRKEPLFYISVITLIPLPFFQLGYGLDFCARVSIPSMFVLMLLVMKYMIEEKTVWRKRVLIAYLCICAIMPSLQILRSMTLTGFQYLSNFNIELKGNNPVSVKIMSKLSEAREHNLLIKDDFYTLDNPANFSIANFMGPVSQSFFYNHLAKKTD